MAAKLFSQLHGWEKQKLRTALRAHEEASTKTQLQSQTKMITTLTAQNKDLKRKVGSVDICLCSTEKAQRSSNNNNYKSVFITDDADEDKMWTSGCDSNNTSLKIRRTTKLNTIYNNSIITTTSRINDNILSQRLRKCKTDIVSYNSNNIKSSLLTINKNGIIQSIRQSHNPTVDWNGIHTERRLIFDTAIDTCIQSDTRI